MLRVDFFSNIANFLYCLFIFAHFFILFFAKTPIAIDNGFSVC